MRLATVNGRAAVIQDDMAIDVHEASNGAFGPEPASVYTHWAAFRAWADNADLDGGSAFDPAALGPVSPSPAQVFAIGLNYRAHVAEGGRELPKFPATFTKFQSCLTGPNADVAVPRPTTDWEVELVVVIGTRAEHVRAADAWSVVAGLTVGQDYSERTTQNASGGHFSMGKSFPGFGPTGPWLVTTDEFAFDAGGPLDLALSCVVSGQLMQSSRTSNMVFDVPAIIEYLSAIAPLLPGDIIFTGTPEGVGMARKPPRWLVAGDTVESTIEGIGTIRNRMV